MIISESSTVLVRSPTPLNNDGVPKASCQSECSPRDREFFFDSYFLDSNETDGGYYLPFLERNLLENESPRAIRDIFR